MLKATSISEHGGNALRVSDDGGLISFVVDNTATQGATAGIGLTREQARRLIDTIATMLDEGEADVRHFEG